LVLGSYVVAADSSVSTFEESDPAIWQGRAREWLRHSQSRRPATPGSEFRPFQIQSKFATVSTQDPQVVYQRSAMAAMEQEQPVTREQQQAQEPTAGEEASLPTEEIMKTKHDTVKNSISNIR
jgi:hypothetical protein